MQNQRTEYFLIMPDPKKCINSLASYPNFYASQDRFQPDTASDPKAVEVGIASKTSAIIG